MSTRPLVLLAHGSRRPGPSSVMFSTAERVRTILPGVEVRTGYIELQPPDPATALEGLVDPVVLPFFLARGYHVLNDVPAAVDRHGSGTVTEHLGVEEHLVEAVAQRLHEASTPLGGIAGLDPVVLGAAGSRQAAALEEVEAITCLLEARLGRRVTPAYLSGARPGVRDAVSTARARGARRVGVATYLLAEGRFHRALHSTGADVVAAIALGAKFGLVGRAYLYGLMAGGREGVDRMIEILSDEVIRTMKLLGVSSIGELEPRHVTQLTRLAPVRPRVKAAADAVAR